MKLSLHSFSPLKMFALVTTVLAVGLTSSSGHSEELKNAVSLRVDGLEYNILGKAYINEHKTPEYSYTLTEKRSVMNTSNIFLYSRDINFDGHPDLWFLVDETGVISSFTQKSNRPFGWDVVESIIHNYHVKKRGIFSVSYQNLTQVLSFGFSALHNYVEELTRKQMDLYELEYYADEMFERNTRSHDASALYKQLSQSWMDLDKEIGSKVWKSRGIAFLDPFIWYFTGKTAGYLVTKSGSAMAYLGSFLGRTAAGKVALSCFEKYSLQFAENMRVVMEKITPKSKFFQASASPTYHVVDKFLTTIKDLSPKERVAKWLEEMHSRGGFSSKISSILEASHSHVSKAGGKVAETTAFQALQGAGREMAYITWTQSLQVAIETFARGYNNTNPIIMTKNIVSDEDLMQNVMFMTLETAQQAGISNIIPDVHTRVKISGAISMLNSRGMSIMVKGETDMKRVALDTGWEVLIGNGQTQLDFWSMSMARRLALRAQLPGLRLLGFVIVTIDQSAGYYVYNKVTMKYEANKKKKAQEKPQVELRPIYLPISKEVTRGASHS